MVKSLITSGMAIGSLLLTGCSSEFTQNYLAARAYSTNPQYIMQVDSQIAEKQAASRCNDMGLTGDEYKKCYYQQYDNIRALQINSMNSTMQKDNSMSCSSYAVGNTVQTNCR